jgi:galactosylceramidase
MNRKQCGFFLGIVVLCLAAPVIKFEPSQNPGVGGRTVGCISFVPAAGFSSAVNAAAMNPISLTIDGNDSGRIFAGLGAVSAGASSRLLFDYSDPQRSDVLDFLFKKKFGAGFQHLKVEIGGGENSTCGSEPSHAITRDELQHPVNRGYELWLMSEARKRNPQIILEGLPWSYPHWLAGIFSQDAADWFVAFLDAARIHYGLDIDYLAAAMNENGTDRNWIVNHLRPSLNAHGYAKVKLQAPDDDSEHWQIFNSFVSDMAFRSVIDAVGYHYVNGREPWEIDQVSGRDATGAAKSSGVPLWASEEWSMSGGYWNGTGAMFLARLINKFYIRDRISKTLIWCPIDAIYKGLPWEQTGAMSADRPWSGHYKVWPAVWALAHTTQFAEPGWQYLDSACGRLAPDSWKATFVTLKNRDTNDWSMVLCTDQDVDIKLKMIHVKFGPVYVWRSDSITQFVRTETVMPEKNLFTLHLQSNSVYTLTTTTGQQKGAHDIPADRPFPFPFKENYDTYPSGATPRYHSDQKGTFAIADVQGHGRCLQQVVPRQGYLWQYMPNVRKPYTVIGDQDWQDYTIAADVFIRSGDVELGGRFGDINKLSYRFILDVKGAWSLAYQDRRLASGRVIDFDARRWHTMKLSMNGRELGAELDGRNLCAVQDSERPSGMAYLASSYDANCFDDLLIEKH